MTLAAAGRRVRRGVRALLALVALAASPAYAAHPFLTEDPGTQGAGRFELELGFASRVGAPDDPGREGAFTPQFSVGALDDLDLIVQAIFLRRAPADAPVVQGSGDLVTDVKWRFYENATLALAVRAGFDLPSGEPATGLGAGRAGWHAVAIAGVTLGECAVYANAGYLRVNQAGTRANLGYFSVALTRPDDAPLKTFVEAAIASNPDPANAQWPAIGRVGAIYTATPWLDVDVGYQARLNRAAARQVWLAGATLRW